MNQKLLGRYIVTDPQICHGQPTFRGTRIMVKQVLEHVASGMAWEVVVEEWRGSVSTDAIAEAVRLAVCGRGVVCGSSLGAVRVAAPAIRH